jgi:cell division septal protein FtsQ
MFPPKKAKLFLTILLFSCYDVFRNMQYRKENVMDKVVLTVALDRALAAQVKAMGKAERRSMSAQAALSIEVGVSEIQRRAAKLAELDLSSGQAREAVAAMAEAGEGK